MAEPITISLGGTPIATRPLNFGQLERVVDAFQGLPAHRVPFEVVRIALERAEPKVDLAEVAPSLDDVRDAANKVLTGSGLAPAAPAGPTEPPPPAA